jgi:hypothetical protein
MKVGDLKLWAELLTLVLGLATAAGTGIADLHLFSAEPALVQATEEETASRDDLAIARAAMVPYVSQAICVSATANYGCDNRFRALDAANAAANAISAATQSTIDDFNSGTQGEDLSAMRLEGSLFLTIPTITAHRTGAQVDEIQDALEESEFFGRGDYQYAHMVERLMTAMNQRAALKSLPTLIPRPQDTILWAYRAGFLLSGLLVGVGGVLAVRRLLLAGTLARQPKPAAGLAG